MKAAKYVLKWKAAAKASALVAAILLMANISPRTLAWDNTLPWCVVNDSGKVLQCFTMKEACMKEADKQQKACVLIPQKK